MKVVLASLVLVGVCGLAAPAGAHQNPPGCNFPIAGISMTGVAGLHRNGDVIPVGVQVANAGAAACDISDATVELQIPNPDGTFNGPIITIAEHLDLPRGANVSLPAVNVTPNFNLGVFRGNVTASVDGVRHVATTDPASAFLASVGQPLNVTHPHATASVTPTPASGPTPLSVTYAYSVQNDSAHDSDGFTPEPEVQDATMSDDTCSSPAYTGGDTNPADGLLTVGETWTFSCMTQLFGGVYTNHATLHGTSTADSRAWPATTAQSTVSVDGADMTLAKSHAGNFTQGDKGRAYTLTATNSGTQPSTGAVSVADSLPSALTPTSMFGTGWNCTLGTLSCTRSDALAAGHSYPPITLMVDVAGDAPPTVTNTAVLARADENDANNGASDPTTILPPPPPVNDQSSASNSQQPDQPPIDTTDRTAPSFIALRITNAAFAVDRRGHPETLVAAKAKKGTAFQYTLSEPARVVFRIDRKAPGRRVGNACRAPTPRNRQRRACTRYVSRGAFAQNSVVGANVRKWSGKLRKALPRGRYRATLVATDAAGNVAIARPLNFRIV